LRVRLLVAAQWAALAGGLVGFVALLLTGAAIKASHDWRRCWPPPVL
jgi:hypothetical protein